MNNPATIFGLTPRRATHTLILGFALLHFVLAVFIPMAPYETHYALYGFYLDFSYLDHPPLTGWLQALPQLFSHHDVAMRIVPIALVTASQYLLARLCTTLFPEQSPWLAPLTLLILNGAVINHLSIAMAPEIPLLLASLLCVFFTQALLRSNEWRYWAGLGLALGLAGISKYTGVTLALSVAIILFSDRGLALLRSPGLWLAGLIAALVISPVIYWNWANDWASFQFQLGYQLDESDDPWSLSDALSAMGEQLGAFSPLLFIGGVAASFKGWQQANARLLIIFAWPILLLFIWMSGAGRSSIHWTLVGWYLLAPLAAAWLMASWHKKPVRWLAKFSGGLSAVLVVGIFLLPLPLYKFPDFQHPLGTMAGWQQAAEHGEKLRQQLPRSGKTSAPVLLVKNWHHAGPLAWYTQGSRTLDVTTRPSQYVRWFGSPDQHSYGIMVQPSSPGKEPDTEFDNFSCEIVDELPIRHGPSLVRKFYFLYCEPK